MLKKIFFTFTAAFLFFGFFFTSRPVAVSSGTENTGASQPIVRYSENFDGVTMPALPAGWSASSTGTGAFFATTTSQSDTAPNAVYTAAPPTTSSASLISPPILVTGATSILSFRHKYAMENTWDGGVLEMSIGTGEFQDILVAGGTFITGGYTTELYPSTNPLSNRFAWSGATQFGFMQTSVRLPSNAFGQVVRFRWRFGSNDSFGSDGWWIDSVKLEAVPTAVNAAPITVSNAGPAAPYPSSIQVSGLPGLVTGVSVSLENFSHSSPADVDLLLVAPNGRSVVLMSDAGGNAAVENVFLTFADSAAGPLPENGPLSSGIFRPTNYGAADDFPPPAPQTERADAFSTLYGSNPNGEWKLFVVNDADGSSGTFSGGWVLDIQTSVNACLFSLSPSAASFPQTGGSGSFQINIPAGCSWTATRNNSFISFASTGSNTIDGTGTGIVDYNVAANFGSGRTGLITVSDGFNQKTFQVQQGSGCPFALSETSLNFNATGGSRSLSVTAGAGCVWNGTTGADWIEITSPSQTGDGTLTLNVSPNATGAARSAIVTVGARQLTVNQTAAAGGSARFDFDGDGRADVAVFRERIWYLLQSANGFSALEFGLSGDRIAPADYDGDGRTDVAVFRDGTWYILRSSDNALQIFQFGLAGDLPVAADYTGDGRDDPALFRDGTWYIYDLAGGETSVFQFGLAGDRPAPADFDGDGRADAAVFRPSNGTWYINRSAQGFFAAQFGLAGDLPVAADYDGNGTADIAVFRDGIWYQLLNLQTFAALQFGLAADVPVPADYDGDGRTDVAVFRGGIWYVLRSSDGQFTGLEFGLAGDRPIPNAFIY